MPVNDSPQSAPDDLMTVREAAQAVGLTPSAVHTWVKRGQLTAQPGPGVRRVSLAAALALVPQPDPHAPADAVALHDAIRHTGVSRTRIASWIRRGLLPSWRGPHGQMVSRADVRAVALHSAAGGDTPLF